MSGKIFQCVYKIFINVLINMSKKKIFKCGENRINEDNLIRPSELNDFFIICMVSPLSRGEFI